MTDRPRRGMLASRGTRAAAALLAAFALVGMFGTARAACGDGANDKPVYLAFDTGTMDIAPLVADVLARQNVRATFFLADQRSANGGTSLDDASQPWWAARAAEGHAFGALLRGASPAQVCASSQAVAERFRQLTGRNMPKIFRVAGGKASPQVVAAASGCDWVNVTSVVPVGDEVASRKVSNRQLLQRTLRDTRAGDVLLAHLSAGPRKDAWAPANLEPLIEGLKSRGLCFASLRDHPAYRAQFSW